MISVIIPLYNHALELDKALLSLAEQTFRDFELIIVDDGSQDNPRENFLSWEAKFKKEGIALRFIGHEKNLGAPAARNTGFRASAGEFLFFCDADAVLERAALERLYKTLKKEEDAAYAYPNFYWGRKLFCPGRFSAEKMKSGPFIHTTALIRREAMPQRGWDESVKKFQDWDLWLTMLSAGKKGVWVDEVLFKIRPGGTMSAWLPSFAYKLLPFLPAVKRYKKALSVIKEKHGLNP